ncbi:hypothetical protein GCM10027273_04240 [Nocardioides pakistanensis]
MDSVRGSGIGRLTEFVRRTQGMCPQRAHRKLLKSPDPGRPGGRPRRTNPGAPRTDAAAGDLRPFSVHPDGGRLKGQNPRVPEGRTP